MNRLVQSAGYTRARGVLGALFIVLGTIILAKLAYSIYYGGHFQDFISGIVLGCAMIALGIVRIRGALAVGRTPAAPERGPA